MGSLSKYFPIVRAGTNRSHWVETPTASPTWVMGALTNWAFIGSWDREHSGLEVTLHYGMPAVQVAAEHIMPQSQPSMLMLILSTPSQ